MKKRKATKVTESPEIAPDAPESALAVPVEPDTRDGSVLPAELQGPDSGEWAEIASVRFSQEDWEALERLTERQRRFVWEYPRDFCGAQAAKRAGYSDSSKNTLAANGSRMLKHPVVGRLARLLASSTADEMGLTREWVAAELQKAAEQAEELEDPRARIKALETIMRLRGDLIHRSQVDVRSVNITINDVDMEDLR